MINLVYVFTKQMSDISCDKPCCDITVVATQVTKDSVWEMLSLCDNFGFVVIFFEFYGHRATMENFLTGIALRMISLSLAVKSDLAWNSTGLVPVAAGLSWRPHAK